MGVLSSGTEAVASDVEAVKKEKKKKKVKKEHGLHKEKMQPATTDKIKCVYTNNPNYMISNIL